MVKYRTCDAEPCTDWANWVATTVATVGACTLPVGSTGIAVDDEDGVWISYYDCVFGNLAVAHCHLPPCTLAGDWTVATVDSLGDVGDSNSIALRAAKYPAVSYRDYTNQRLKYARCRFGITSECDWTVSVLDDGTYDAPYEGPGFGSSLEFSPDTDPAGNGRPRIAYWDGETSELLHGVCGMASCATFPTYALAENEGAVSFKVGLGLDPSNEGAAYVAYFNNEAAGCGSDSCPGELRLVRAGSDTWEAYANELVDGAEGAGLYPSLGVTESGGSKIAYYRFVPGAPHEVRFATQISYQPDFGYDYANPLFCPTTGNLGVAISDPPFRYICPVTCPGQNICPPVPGEFSCPWRPRGAPHVAIDFSTYNGQSAPSGFALLDGCGFSPDLQTSSLESPDRRVASNDGVVGGVSSSGGSFVGPLEVRFTHPTGAIAFTMDLTDVGSGGAATIELFDTSGRSVRLTDCHAELRRNAPLEVHPAARAAMGVRAPACGTRT